MIARFPGKCARTGRAIRPGDVITFTAARKAVLVQHMHNDPQGVSDTSARYCVRMRDDDSGNWLPVARVYSTEVDALAYAHHIAGVTVTVSAIALGWLVRVRGDHQATLGGQNLFDNEADALAYARRITC